MPVITVLTPARDDTSVLLQAVADAVAGALELGPGGVIAQSVTPAATVASGGHGTCAPWIVVTIQESDRGHERIDLARSAAEATVRSWAQQFEIEIGGVWSQWQTPTATLPAT